MAGQLSLFKGKRQRGVAPPPPLEDALHIALADILRASITKGWRWTYMPFGEYRHPATAALLKRKGVSPGWPDFMFVSESGAMAWLELKRPRHGRLSAVQGEMGEFLSGLPRTMHVYAVMSDLRAAVRWLKENGVVRSVVT